jgi:hypothetical protein
MSDEDLSEEDIELMMGRFAPPGISRYNDMGSMHQTRIVDYECRNRWMVISFESLPDFYR